MSKEKVLETLEIENIKKVRDNFQILVGQIGEIEVAIINLNRRKKEVEVELEKIQQEEIKIAEELETKYGKGNISLETGKFTPIG
mgnify:CR=1 FL=1|jgi:hypothetical protein|tara:strand:+ start:1537 stop:1791 length:255 start_codon:yes stop_codon:yes gene_type:complete